MATNTELIQKLREEFRFIGDEQISGHTALSIIEKAFAESDSEATATAKVPCKDCGDYGRIYDKYGGWKTCPCHY